MAKLLAMPSLATVQTLKGSLDFYLWKGIPVCRRWPRPPAHQRNAAVRTTAARFAYINNQVKVISPGIIEAYKDIPFGHGWTWKDFMVSFWYKGSTSLTLVKTPEEA